MHTNYGGGTRRKHVAHPAIVAFAAMSVVATLTACGDDGAREARTGSVTANDGAAAHVAEAEHAGTTGDVRADAAYDVAVAQAEGAHSVAVERCGALTGDARDACRDRADAELELAKSRAKQARDART